MKEKYLFVGIDGMIPLLYPTRNVARQFEIETWLDLAQLKKDLGLEVPKQVANEKWRKYVV